MSNYDMQSYDTQIQYDVVGIGNAIVDILSYVDDDFLARNSLKKGTMQLVDEAQSAALYKELGQTTECSGGSVANTLAGIASLGGKTAFIGKVADDQLGRIFTHDLRSVGVHFTTNSAKEGPATANCLVCVTPDAQRTMATFIGACNRVTISDIDHRLIAQAKILYIEGYLWDIPQAKEAIRAAIAAAKTRGRKVALTLSDSFCVNRFRSEFLALINEEVDILFANEAELLALFEVDKSDNSSDDLNKAIEMLQGKCEVAAITCSEKGAVIVTDKNIEHVGAERVEKLVDTTGAGDLFAAGFLFGYANGRSHKQSAILGNRCAGHIIQQLGARTMRSLENIIAEFAA